MSEQSEDEPDFVVVVNAEEQYSVWPAVRAVPDGWRAVGVTGPKSDCLEHISAAWTDMRPLSLRQAADG
jgi:MbtH protein